MTKPSHYNYRFFATHLKVLFTFIILLFGAAFLFAYHYWGQISFLNGRATRAPRVLANSPLAGLTNIGINTPVSVIFSKPLDPATVNSTNFELKDNSDRVIPVKIHFSVNSSKALLIPGLALHYSTTYTVTVKGGETGIKDLEGNKMATDFAWSFTVTAPPYEGAGGPILIISSSLSPFSSYMAEILRAQGYTCFRVADIAEVNAAMLDSFDVILLGKIPVVASEARILSEWTAAGGTLIAQRPGTLLLPLMGVESSGTIPDNNTNTYLLADTAMGLPGAGIVDQTIQYHGVADIYTMLPGTKRLATLYSSANTATANPAITIANVGTHGGKAIAFAFDLAKSVVLTRQGNIAWAGRSRDGQTGPIRADNLFFPNYVDFNKIQIPQADELQHLLTNIILLSNLHRKPLPHLWLLPGHYKAAVVMTGDDHNNESYPGSSGTAGRFNEYIRLSGANNNPVAVDDWKAIRATSYVYNNITIPDDSVDYYQSMGFEIALHPTTACTNFTKDSLTSLIINQLTKLQTQLPDLDPMLTNRTHCMPWNDWSTLPEVEDSLGIRFDVNYYYWPGSWVKNRPGMFTGSGMPMRFSDDRGNILDVYQAPTLIPDESRMDIPFSINTLLDNAIKLGYYGAFVMNMHMDTALHTGSDEIIAAARARNIPVISARQLLTWLDNRNNTVFSHITWLNNKLSFDITTSAYNLRAMVPLFSAEGTLTQVTENGRPISYKTQTIKGIQYGIFPARTNSYVAIYSGTSLSVSLINLRLQNRKPMPG